MENIIRLPSDLTERRTHLLGLRRTKLGDVKKYIEQQIQAFAIANKSNFQFHDSFECFGMFYTVDFSVNKVQNTTVSALVDKLRSHLVVSGDAITQQLHTTTFRKVFLGFHGIHRIRYHAPEFLFQVLDTVDDSILHVRIIDRVHIPKRYVRDRGFLVTESNAVFFAHVASDHAILVSDAVDEDPWHPYQERQGRIRKDLSVGILLRQDIAEDGTPVVMVQRFSFIKHHLRRYQMRPDLLQAMANRVFRWGELIISSF